MNSNNSSDIYRIRPELGQYAILFWKNSARLHQPVFDCARVFLDGYGWFQTSYTWCCNPDNNALKLCSVLVQVRFTTSKTKLDIW